MAAWYSVDGCAPANPYWGVFVLFLILHSYKPGWVEPFEAKWSGLSVYFLPCVSKYGIAGAKGAHGIEAVDAA